MVPRLDILLLVLLFFFKDAFTLKDVLLTIQPKTVQRTKEATLTCSYNLEGDNLYYVRWYKENYEFFRYTPNNKDKTKIFPLTGVTIDVNRSNGTQVVLKDVDFQLSGNFSCEVNTTNPISQRNSQRMLVVELPLHPPKISGMNSGDVLTAECASPPSRPPANLKIFLNEFKVASSPVSFTKRTEEFLWSNLTLELPLQDYHFDKGRLILKCVAEIYGIYHEVTTLEVKSYQNDPVPEKESSMPQISSSSHFHYLNIILLIVSKISFFL